MMMHTSEFADRIIRKYADDEELRELLITHSECVARKALDVAAECGLTAQIDPQFVWDASMLHDIGVVECDAPSIHCHGKLPYICHGTAGAALLRREGVGERYCRVCERHTGSGLTAAEIEERGLPLPLVDFLPETLEEKLICYADKFFSKSGDPRQEKDLPRIIASMSKHGAAALERFMSLHNEFASRGEDSTVRKTE